MENLSPGAPPMAGAQAIEVTAMLGDSVVGVKHCTNPRGGNVTTCTYALFAAAVVMFVMAAVSFGKSVTVAKQNKQDLQEWVSVNKRSAHRFQERRLPVGYDVMTFGGFAAGLVCFSIGLLRVREERVSPGVTIGGASDVDFACGTLGAGAFPLVAPQDDQFVVNVAPTMEGEVVQNGVTTPLSALRYVTPSLSVGGASSLAVPQHGQLTVRVGNTSFAMRSVAKPKRYSPPVFVGLTTAAAVSVVGTAVVVFGLLGVIRSIPPDMDALAVDLNTSEARQVPFRATANEQDDPTQRAGQASDAPGGTGTAMALEPGKMGTRDSDRSRGRYRIAKVAPTPALSRHDALQHALTAGVVGELRANMGHLMHSITSTSDITSGLDDATVYGGLLGDTPGEMYGGFGFGPSGFGPGGGGPGLGTIGQGRYNTIGAGDGTGPGYRTGPGGGDKVRKRKPKPPVVSLGSLVSTGDLDRATIRRYIRRRRAQVTYCYEKELQVKQSLRGTVVANFVISAGGAVTEARASGVDREVAACIARTIRSIQFPRPKGGGVVQVRYPFHVRSR